MYSRRSLLGRALKGACALAFSPVFFALRKPLAHADEGRTFQEEETFDCLILGGGIAGMAAANALAYPRSADQDLINSKPRSVLVIEGQGRLGGRLYTKHQEGFPGSIELGAQYVHVDDKKNDQGRRFSLWQAFDEYGIRISPIHRLFCGVAFSKYFSKLRKHWQIVFELPIGWLLCFRSEISKYAGADMSLRQWLDSGPKGGAPNEGTPPGYYSPKERGIIDIYLSGPASGPLEKMSLRGFNLDRFASLDEGDYEYKVNPGWSYFMDQLKFPLRSFVRNPFVKGEIPVKYHSQVTRIEYHPDHVLVTVREAQNARPGPAWDQAPVTEKTYRARTAIVTFPIGILRRAAGIDEKNPSDRLQFVPPLPAAKIKALKAIGVGVAAKLFIVFESRFWDEDIGLVNRVDGLGRMGRTYFVSNYGEKRGNVVLGAYLGGPEAQRVLDLGWSEEEILKAVCDELGEIFPEVQREKSIFDRVKRDDQGKRIFVYKNWAQDPWAYGNDSYLVFDAGDPDIARAMPSARRELASPALTGALHWAGEATVYDDGNHGIYALAHAGVSHGAHASGLRAAKEVAAYLDRGER